MGLVLLILRQDGAQRIRLRLGRPSLYLTQSCLNLQGRLVGSTYHWQAIAREGLVGVEARPLTHHNLVCQGHPSERNQGLLDRVHPAARQNAA